MKVLDFGLAKVTPMSTAGLEGLSTIGGTSTTPGVLLGTVGYMAPEQVRGEPVDARADLFALGCVLYEMLTGERAFLRDNTVATLPAILDEDPRALRSSDWTVPPALVRILRHCLQKQPERRYRSAHDLGFDLEGLTGAPAATVGPTSRATASSRWRPAVGWGCAVVLGSLATYALWRLPVHEPAMPRQVERFVIPLPPPMADVGRPFGTAVALSPDGSSLVYVARDENATRLDLRPLDEVTARPLAGTRGASAPFFSSDGRSARGERHRRERQHGYLGR